MDPEAILAAIEQQRDSNAEPREEQERVSYLAFYLGEEVYGLPLEQLREVARVSHLRRVPGAPAGVAGLVNLRGEILCALDVRAILGLPAHASTDTPFLVALRGFGDPLGLIVDSIADIYSVSSRDIEAPPATWPAERAACFIGTARVAAGLMGLLDLARVTKI
jgi:purine-binding chemotaxis protein CheW